MRKTSLHDQSRNLRLPLRTARLLNPIQKDLVPALLLDPKIRPQLQRERVVRPHPHDPRLHHARTRQTEGHNLRVEVHLVDADGDVGADLIGGGGSGGAGVHYFAEGGGADAVAALEEVVGMPEVLGMFGS